MPSHAARAATQPTFIQEAETVWNNGTSPKTTGSLSIQSGDILVAFTMQENAGNPPTISISNSGAALSWTLQVDQPGVVNSSEPYLRMWTATGDSARSLTVTFTNSGGSLFFGGNVLLFRGSSGVGAVASTNNGTGSGAPSLNITTTQANSTIVVANVDWNAVDGASRTWRTNAGALTEQTYDFESAHYTVYGGYHATAGAAGTYAVGLSNPSTQRYAIGAIEVKPAAGIQVSSRSDALSDPRPSATSNHTIVFTVNNAVYGSSLSGSSTIVLGLDPAFTIPAAMDCGDVDAATSVQFSFNYPGCVATATAWGFSATGSVITLVPPSGTGVYVPTSTQVTIKIGSNATQQQQGAHWITNPSAAGVYTISVGGTFGGSGNMLVSINAGVQVSATIAESLALTASSVNAVNCTADDGATVNSVTSTATSVPFGTISPNTFYQGCQDLIVSTNAGNGYALTVQESSAMKTANGQFTIPDTTCDAGTCSESAAAAWATATHNGFGHTCANQLNHDCNAAYSSGTLFRQAADLSAGETAQSVMSSSTSATATGRIKFRISPSSAQAAGTYTTIITYIITGTY